MSFEFDFESVSSFDEGSRAAPTLQPRSMRRESNNEQQASNNVMNKQDGRLQTLPKNRKAQSKRTTAKAKWLTKSQHRDQHHDLASSSRTPESPSSAATSQLRSAEGQRPA
jgi:hypothetical protein